MYIVKVDEKEYKIDLEKEAKGFKISLDGNFMKVEVIENSPSHLSLIVDNKPYDIIIQDENTISVDGESYNVKVEDERLQEIKKLKGEDELTEEVTVTASMPGLIIKIEVNEGDKVKAGQGLAIIEAMKMQNEVKASRDGIVKQILVKKGITVNGGDALIILE